jgi:hypothetical protein
MRAPRRSLVGVATVAVAVVLASGCGNTSAVAPVFDDVVSFAGRPPVALPSAPFRASTPPPLPRSARLPDVQPQPSPVLPEAVSRAPVDSELVATFVICDGVGFYLENGYMPGPGDWPNLFGGYLLSRVPAYQAEQIGEQLTAIAESSQPVLEAARISHALSCAAL